MDVTIVVSAGTVRFYSDEALTLPMGTSHTWHWGTEVEQGDARSITLWAHNPSDVDVTVTANQYGDIPGTMMVTPEVVTIPAGLTQDISIVMTFSAAPGYYSGFGIQFGDM
jgi:hypothetical protein